MEMIEGGLKRSGDQLSACGCYCGTGFMRVLVLDQALEHGGCACQCGETTIQDFGRDFMYVPPPR